MECQTRAIATCPQAGQALHNQVAHGYTEFGEIRTLAEQFYWIWAEHQLPSEDTGMRLRLGGKRQPVEDSNPAKPVLGPGNTQCDMPMLRDRQFPLQLKICSRLAH